MARIKICREKDCSNAATTAGYCRLHYLRHWKSIKDEQRRAAARKLNRYIEHVCRKNPEGYMEEIRRDLRNPEFSKFIDDKFGADDGDFVPFEAENINDEDIEELIRKLKIEEGF